MNQWYVLNCLIFTGSNRGHLLSELREEYFYQELPKLIFLYIKELYSKNLTIDVPLLKSHFPDYTGEIEKFFSLDMNIESSSEYGENIRKVFVKREFKY